MEDLPVVSISEVDRQRLQFTNAAVIRYYAEVNVFSPKLRTQSRLLVVTDEGLRIADTDGCLIRSVPVTSILEVLVTEATNTVGILIPYQDEDVNTRFDLLVTVPGDVRDLAHLLRVLRMPQSLDVSHVPTMDELKQKVRLDKPLGWTLGADLVSANTPRDGGSGVQHDATPPIQDGDLLSSFPEPSVSTVGLCLSLAESQQFTTTVLLKTVSQHFCDIHQNVAEYHQEAVHRWTLCHRTLVTLKKTVAQFQLKLRQLDTSRRMFAGLMRDLPAQQSERTAELNALTALLGGDTDPCSTTRSGLVLEAPSCGEFTPDSDAMAADLESRVDLYGTDVRKASALKPLSLQATIFSDDGFTVAPDLPVAPQMCVVSEHMQSNIAVLMGLLDQCTESRRRTFQTYSPLLTRGAEIHHEGECHVRVMQERMETVLEALQWHQKLYEDIGIEQLRRLDSLESIILAIQPM